MKRVFVSVMILIIAFVSMACNMVVDKNEDGGVQEGAANPTAIITVKDKGKMVIELYPAKAPNTVKNFVSLAESGYYDGLTFHRIVYGFMIQGGCPEGTGMGNPGYSIKGEFSSNGFKQNDISHKRGIISMARSQMPDSAGSQFFIIHQDNAGLDGQYAAFGKLIEGEEVLDTIAKAAVSASATGEQSVPVNEQIIESIIIERNGWDGGEPEKIK